MATEETNPEIGVEATAEAPKRRRVSRRVVKKTDESALEVTEAAAAETAEAPAEPAAEAPKKRVSRARKKAAAAEENNAAEAAETAEAGTAEDAADEPKKRVTRGRRKKADIEAEAAAAETETAAQTAETGYETAETAEVSEPKQRTSRTRRTKAATAEAEQTDATEAAAGETSETGETEAAAEKPARTRGRRAKKAAETETSAETGETAASDGSAEADTAAETGENEAKDGSNSETAQRENGRNRTRQRDRKRRNNQDDFDELTEEDVLLPIGGILDVLDNYAFVRTTGYLPGVSDVYVSLSQVKRYGLRKGDAIVGAIRQPREDNQNTRQKYNALVKIDTINGATAEEAAQRPEFAKLTPIAPDQHIAISDHIDSGIARAIDLFAPLAVGQRGVISALPGSGITETLVTIGNGYGKALPDAHLVLALVGTRPEEVTELQRSFNGEVIAATADAPVEDKLTVVELALERSKRLVEIGHDVVLLIDSIAAFEDAYALANYNPRNPIVLTRGLDPLASAAASSVFAAARNIENGGSLTIYTAAAAYSHTSEDLQRTANWTLELDLSLAQAGIFPALHLNGTRSRLNQADNPASETIAKARQTQADHSAFAGNGADITDIIAALNSAKTRDEAATKIAALLA
ncbi:MAG: transcription termination factor Rho [Microbacteriaceae bacterium]|nr:transcription termination factor Rho [Microbacteriaceae bacterium]